MVNGDQETESSQHNSESKTYDNEQATSPEVKPTSTVQGKNRNKSVNITTPVTSNKPLRNNTNRYLFTNNIISNNNFRTNYIDIKNQLIELGQLDRFKFPIATMLITRNILELFISQFIKIHELRLNSGLENNIKTVISWLKNGNVKFEISTRKLENLAGQLSQLKAKVSDESTADQFGSSIFLMHALNHDAEIAVTADDALQAWSKIEAVISQLLKL